MFVNLRNIVLIVAATLVALASAVAADAPFIRSAKEVKWGAPPPVLPPGAKFAVIAGDPASSGLVTVRIEMPAGYTIPPHYHPTDEHVTVLKGSLSLGMGDVIDKTHALTLSTGGYGVAWRTCITMRTQPPARPFRCTCKARSRLPTSILPMTRARNARHSA
jgi:hypothetical protein